jgi:hypothetical protein
MYRVTWYGTFSVQIYPSEFGLKRMKEEESRGPLELVGDGSSVQDGKEEEEDEEVCHAFSYMFVCLFIYLLEQYSRLNLFKLFIWLGLTIGTCQRLDMELDW